MKETIGDVQTSMKIVFGDIAVDALVSAEEIGTFTFTKGESRNFLYENLSAGGEGYFRSTARHCREQGSIRRFALLHRRAEAHLNTKVQRTLLKELCRLIPEHSQLWVATHSIGMVRAAQDMHAADCREQVVFLDMDSIPTECRGTMINRRPSNRRSPGTLLEKGTTSLH